MISLQPIGLFFCLGPSVLLILAGMSLLLLLKWRDR